MNVWPKGAGTILHLWERAQEAAENNPKFPKRKSGRKRKKGANLEKGETYRITYSLIKEGKSIEEISTKRNLAASTIEQHVARGISDGEVDIFSVLSDETVNEVTRLMQDSPDSIGDIQRSQNGKYSYGVLRMVRAHLSLS